MYIDEEPGDPQPDQQPIFIEDQVADLQQRVADLTHRLLQLEKRIGELSC